MTAIISMPIYPLQRVFYPQNRPCTPKIVGTFYMQGYKVKKKNSNCIPLYPQFQNSVGTLHYIAEILLRVLLNTIKPKVHVWYYHFDIGAVVVVIVW
jgi:hypothetical protein